MITDIKDNLHYSYNPIMKIKNIILTGIFIMAMSAIGAGCSQNDYLVFDEDYSGIYFTEDSIHYSFGTLPIERHSYTQPVPVQIMGAPASYDRIFTVETLPSVYNETPREGYQYEMEANTLIIPADSITGNIPLVLLRDGLAGDDETGYTRYELRLKLVENNNFAPTLSDKEQHVVITFDNSIEKPSWYSEAVWVSKCGEWAPIKLIKLMEYFHTILKEEAPVTYDKMVSDIGENWEDVTYGWPTDYNYTVKKYILIPEYEYFLNHPEHGITDFPNPND